MITSFGGLDLPGQCNSLWETCRKCGNGPSVEHCRWHLSGAVPACYPPVYPYFALITLPGTVSAGQYCQYRQYFPALRHAKNFSAPGKPHSPLKVPYGIRTALQAGPAGKQGTTGVPVTLPPDADSNIPSEYSPWYAVVCRVRPGYPEANGKLVIKPRLRAAPGITADTPRPLPCVYRL